MCIKPCGSGQNSSHDSSTTPERTQGQGWPQANVPRHPHPSNPSKERVESPLVKVHNCTRRCLNSAAMEEESPVDQAVRWVAEAKRRAKDNEEDARALLREALAQDIAAEMKGQLKGKKVATTGATNRLYRDARRRVKEEAVRAEEAMDDEEAAMLALRREGAWMTLVRPAPAMYRRAFCQPLASQHAASGSGQPRTARTSLLCLSPHRRLCAAWPAHVSASCRAACPALCSATHIASSGR